MLWNKDGKIYLPFKFVSVYYSTEPVSPQALHRQFTTMGDCSDENWEGG